MNNYVYFAIQYLAHLLLAVFLLLVQLDNNFVLTLCIGFLAFVLQLSQIIIYFKIMKNKEQQPLNKLLLITFIPIFIIYFYTFKIILT